jgi:zinc carboxypeptidase/carboxypeptidase M14-like protein
MRRVIYPVLGSALLLFPAPPDLFAQATPPVNAASALRVSSNFPGGSAKVLNLDPTNNFVRITPAGDPERGWPCWWYLRLDGITPGKPVQLEVVANEAVVPFDDGGSTRKLAPNWSLPARAAFSIDGRNWEQTAPGERKGKQSSYRVNTTSRTLWLAWGPPFVLQDANDLIERAARLNPYVRHFELARTREGRPVPALSISQPGASGRERFGVWVQARQHAWECGSSWISCGLTEWLVSNDPAAESLRKMADITIVPIMDVDSVETGNGGKQQKPYEHNRDWGVAPHIPEIRAAADRISSLVRTGRFDVFLDLHNPGASERGVFIYIPPRPLLDPVRLANQKAFTNFMRAQLTGPIPFTGKIAAYGDTYDPATDKTVDAWAAHEGGSPVVSLTVETAWNTPGSTSTGYRKVGEQLGRAIESYLRSGPIRPDPRK